MKEVAFVVRLKSIGSSQVRGVQIAQALDAALLTHKELAAGPVAGLKTIVYVKELPPLALVQRLSDAGVVQVLDALDNYGWRRIGRAAPFLTHFIAANHTHALELTRRFALPATRIPHHHCNFGDEHIPVGREPPTLGYIGGRDHWPESRRIIRRLPYPVLAHHGPGRTLREAYCAVDIGFAWRSGAQKFSYNSAVKLVNFMSFGIPSVLSAETGYVEISRHHEACLYAQSKGEFSMMIEHLATSPALRRQLGEAGRELARPYHIRSIVPQYRELLGSLTRNA